MPINDGGPAFPCAGNYTGDDGPPANDNEPQEGMSLRDYFAAAALTGIIAGAERINYGGNGGSAPDCLAPSAADDAYRYADAMLAVRAIGSDA